MADDGAKRGIKSLVSAALAAGTPAAAGDTPARDDSPPPPGATAAASGAPATGESSDPGADAEAAELIAVYFELEEPVERDALFNRISGNPSPLVTDFLRAMMHEDEDEYVRAAAAAELARRGVAEGFAALEADLEEPEELYFFEHSMQTLSELKGLAFYETAAAIWKNSERDADERREAMIGMETSDPTRALADFQAFIEATDIQAMADDQIEVAMLAFVRHGYHQASEALAGLRQRIAAAPLDADERAELEGFVQEGIDLLAAS